MEQQNQVPQLDLRHLNIDDLQWLYELESDPEVMQYTDRPPQTLAQIQRELPVLISNYQNPLALQLWVIEHNTRGAIGTAAFYLNQDNEFEIGYKLMRCHWQQGLGSAALNLLLHRVRQRFPLQPLVAYAFKDNIASCRMLLRHGFQLTRSWFNSDYGMQDCRYELAADTVIPSLHRQQADAIDES